MTYYGGEVVPTTQPAGFDGWPLLQQAPAAFPAPAQPVQPVQPFPPAPPIQPVLSGQLGNTAPMGLSAGPGVPAPGWALTPPLGAGPVPAESLRQHAAALLQRCYHWLEAAVPVVPQVSWLVSALVTAVQQYEAQQYEACLAQTMAVVHTVRQVQVAVPTLPPL